MRVDVAEDGAAAAHPAPAVVVGDARERLQAVREANGEIVGAPQEIVGAWLEDASRHGPFVYQSGWRRRRGTWPGGCPDRGSPGSRRRPMLSAMPANPRRVKRFKQAGKQIACLACRLPRVVFGFGASDTGDCPRCGYRGWDYSDELDGFTQRSIADGAFTGAIVERRQDPGRRVRAA